MNQKVETLSSAVEKTQQRTQKNEKRIEEVNRNAEAGVSDAKNSALFALKRADDAERVAKGKLIYVVSLSNDKVKFPFNRASISEEAKKLIDDTVGPIAAENRGVFFEIEGHTDSSGPQEYNRRLGEERALAVREYLHDQHSIALARMEVISYGALKPVVDNDTREHRAMNRRVVIRVLE